jgi:hypothetical protein
MAKLIGNAPNQVPTNADLGSMAFEDKKNYATTSSPIYQPFRNIIINGDMSIAQRGTSFTGLTTGGNAYTIDRWKYMQAGATTSVFTLTQDSDVPSGQGFAKSLKMDCTTADTSVATSDIVWLMQRVEAQNLQYLKFGTSNAESLTLSFWTKSNKTGTYAVNIYQNDGADNRVLNYTISSADTWEKKTITFSGNTTNAPSNNNGIGFWVNFTLIAGTHYTSTEDTSWHSYTDSRRAFGHNVNLADSTANEWFITGVQLEAGTTASDFEFLPYDVNLKRCQRYYHKYPNSGSNIGASYNGSSASFFIYFPTTMRATPTTSSASGSDYYRFYRLSSYDSITSLGDNGKSEEYMSFSFATTSAAGTGGELSVRSGGVLEAEAEL